LAYWRHSDGWRVCGRFCASPLSPCLFLPCSGDLLLHAYPYVPCFLFARTAWLCCAMRLPHTARVPTMPRWRFRAAFRAAVNTPPNAFPVYFLRMPDGAGITSSHASLALLRTWVWNWLVTTGASSSFNARGILFPLTLRAGVRHLPSPAVAWRHFYRRFVALYPTGATCGGGFRPACCLRRAVYWPDRVRGGTLLYSRALGGRCTRCFPMRVWFHRCTYRHGSVPLLAYRFLALAFHYLPRLAFVRFLTTNITFPLLRGRWTYCQVWRWVGSVPCRTAHCAARPCHYITVHGSIAAGGLFLPFWA